MGLFQSLRPNEPRISCAHQPYLHSLFGRVLQFWRPPDHVGCCSAGTTTAQSACQEHPALNTGLAKEFPDDASARTTWGRALPCKFQVDGWSWQANWGEEGASLAADFLRASKFQVSRGACTSRLTFWRISDSDRV